MQIVNVGRIFQSVFMLITDLEMLVAANVF